MAGFVDFLFDQMLDVFATEATTMSLHSGDPGSTGADELVGVEYSRQSVTWGTPSGGEVSATAPVEFGVPAATSVTHVGFRDGSDNWLGSVVLDEPEIFAGPGEIELDPITISLDN